MADFEFSYSAACLINLADSTSAFAEMILLSANLLSFAALERESCKSLLNWISLMNIYSICFKRYLHQHPIILHTDPLVFQYHLRSIVFFPTNLEG